MADLTTRMKWTIPPENVDPYYDRFLSLMNQVDAAAWAAREDRNLQLLGGGDISFVLATGRVEWTASLQLFSPLTGFLLSIPAGGVNLADNQILYCTLVRALTANQVATGVVGSKVPSEVQGDDQYLLAMRYGGKLYWRNGCVLADGEVSEDFHPPIQFVPGGDLSGTAISQTVIGIQGRPVNSGAPGAGQILQWSGAEWIPADLTDPDAIHDNVASEISAITEKIRAVDADLLLLEDSAAALVKKKLQFSNLPMNLVNTLVGVTPYMADRDQVYLVRTGAIGGPSTLNLTTDVPRGRGVLVKDYEGAAGVWPITVQLPAMHSFVDGNVSKQIWTHGGCLFFMRTGTLTWRTFIESSHEKLVTILGSLFTTNQAGFQRATSWVFSPEKYPETTGVRLQMVLETSNVLATTTARLWDVTAGAQVGADMTSTSLTPEAVFQNLDFGVDIPWPFEHVYEIQLRRNGGAVGDYVTVSFANFRFRYSLAQG